MKNVSLMVQLCNRWIRVLTAVLLKDLDHLYNTKTTKYKMQFSFHTREKPALVMETDALSPDPNNWSGFCQLQSSVCDYW